MINSILSSTAAWQVTTEPKPLQMQDYVANYVVQTPHVKEVNKPVTKPDCGCDASGNDENKSTLLDRDSEMFLKEFSNNMSILDKASSSIKHAKTPEEIEKSTKKFVEQYNKTVDFLAEHKEENRTLNRFHQSLTSVGKTSDYSLADIGISVGKDGKMTLDESKLSSSISNNADKVKDTIGYVADKTQAVTNRATYTSTQQLIQNDSPLQSENQDKYDKYQEAYHASIRMMGSNAQFMNYYYSAQVATNMINALV